MGRERDIFGIRREHLGNGTDRLIKNYFIARFELMTLQSFPKSGAKRLGCSPRNINRVSKKYWSQDTWIEFEKIIEERNLTKIIVEVKSEMKK